MSTTKVAATTLDLGGKTVGSLTVNAIGATVVFARDITCGIFAPSGGTIDANGFNLNCLSLSNGNTTTRTMNMRGGTITMRGTGTIFDTPAGVLTYAWTAGAKFVISDTSATAKSFAGGTNATLPLIEVLGAASNGIVTFSGAFTCAGLKFNPDASIKFTAGTTLTTSVPPVMVGTSGHVITIQSTSSGSAATISCASGVIAGDYLSLKDSTVTGGAVFNPGIHSTDVSGNRGWRFAPNLELPFTDGSGTIAADSSGGGRPGTLSGSPLPTWLTNIGALIGGVLFDGVHNYVNIPNGTNPLVGDTHAVSIWFKTTGVSNSPLLWYATVGGLEMFIEYTPGGDGVYWGYRGAGGSYRTYSSMPSLIDGALHSLIAVKDGSLGVTGGALYLDGVLMTTYVGDFGTNAVPAANDLVIAQYTGSPGTYNFNGSIGDLRLYSRFVDAAEAAYIASNPPLVPTFTPSLLCAW